MGITPRPPLTAAYTVAMPKQKERASRQVRLYPSTHRKAKLEAARRGVSIARLFAVLIFNVK